LAFPIPSLLASIEDLLVEVAWLDGMILVTESQEATFLPVAQVNPVLAKLRSKPRGAEVADKLSLSLLKSQGKRETDAFGWGLLVQACPALARGISTPSPTSIAALQWVNPRPMSRSFQWDDVVGARSDRRQILWF
jgi:hypothetical protein